MRKEMEIHKKSAPKLATEENLKEVTRRIEQSPFSGDILSVKRPDKLLIPVFKLFDGSADPLEHVLYFQQKIEFETEDQQLHCRIFPFSLSGAALSWFKSLFAGSISNFQMLYKKFIAQYNGHRSEDRSITALFSLKQRQTEGLRQFLKRFQAHLALIEDSDTRIVAQALRYALIPDSPLYRHMVQHKVTTMEDSPCRGFHAVGGGLECADEKKISSSNRRS